MKRLLPFASVGISLIGLALMWNALEAGALPPPGAGAGAPAVQGQPVPTNTPAAPEGAIRSTIYEAPSSLAVAGMSEQAQPEATIIEQLAQDDDHIQQALQQAEALRQAGVRFQVTNPLSVQPTNTPAAPERDTQSTLNQLPSSLAVAGMPERTQTEAPIAEQRVQDNDYVQWALQHAEALRQAGVRFQVINSGVGVAGSASPRSLSETCVNVLLNSQMDVVEFGDGTGSIEYWSILFQKIYYDKREGYYHSPSYSLAMVDEAPGWDTDVIEIEGTTWDYDEFGQGFRAPGGLTYLKISYSRLYSNTNLNDKVWSNLWTLDSQGYKDELIDYRSIGEDPEGWSNRYWTLDSSQLAAVSGKSLALVFDMQSNQTSPSEFVWLDDAQVRLCYTTGANKVYLPLTIRQTATSPVPICSPYEPDSTAQRGSTTVGATCSDSFGATDMKDYYSLNLNGVTKVRLRLFSLPSGTNWDAMIYEDASGYPLACHIGTIGDQDKSKDCSELSLSKNYFVLVNAGKAPSAGANTYQMSVEQR